MAADAERHWTLDRRIPLAFLFGIAVQTAILAFSLGQLYQRVDGLERQVDRGAGANDRLTRVEVQLTNIETAISRIENRMEKAK